MEEFNEERKEIDNVKQSLRNKFLAKGLSEKEVELEMIKLNVDFLLHSYINDGDVKKKLDSYMKTLEMYLEEI